MIKHLLQAPSLYLPDYTKLFFLFVHSQQGHALEILCQKAGDIWGPLAYLSKQLNLLILRWPPHLQALAATTLLIPEAQTLTRNAPLNACSPHSFQDLLSHEFPFSAPCWTTDPPRTPPRHSPFFFMPCKPLNPASLLPTPDPKAEHLFHDCVQTLDMTLNPSEHITDQPLTDPKVPSWFIDGTAQKQAPFGAQCSIVQGQPDKVIPLTSSSQPHCQLTHSHQQVELIALTQALTLAKDQKINNYTDSKYVYNVLHSNIIIWRKERFLTQKDTPVLNASFISELLHVAQLPKQAALIHGRRHQRHSPISFYNNVTDHDTKQQAASVSPVFSIAQIDEPNIHTLLSYLHSLFHPSTKVLKACLQNFIKLTKDDVTYLNNLTQTCTICQQTNPNIRPHSFPHPPNSQTSSRTRLAGRFHPHATCRKG